MVGKLKRKWCAYRRDPKSFVLFLSVCLAALITMLALIFIIAYRSRWLQSNYKNKRIILFVDARAIMHLYGICVPIHRELNSPASIHTKG